MKNPKTNCKFLFKKIIFSKQLLVLAGVSLVALIILTSIELYRSRISNVASVGFSILIEPRSRSTFETFTSLPIIESEKRKGTFMANDNNLGMVLVKFDNHGRANEDILTFRLKEKGNSEWLYEHPYTVAQFQNNQYFTFGFPPIPNSKNMPYEFELESSQGTEVNSVSISEKAFPVAIAYQTSVKELRNPATLISFLVKKVIFALTMVDYNLLKNISLFALAVVLVWAFSDNLSYIGKEVFLAFNKNTRRVLARKIQHYYSLVYAYLAEVLDSASSLISNNAKRTILIGAVIIMVAAVISRVGFYIEPNFLTHRFFSGLGSGNDYSVMITDSIWYTVDPDAAFKRSIINDNPFLVRYFSSFFKLFGLIDGLVGISYGLIVMGVVVAFLPYIVLTDFFKKFSAGGLLASLFIAINPQIVGNSITHPVDATTNFFFMFFVILYFAALKRRRYLLAMFLGLAAFADGLNRGIMFINHFPSLIMFALLYIYFAYRNKTLDRKEIVYAFAPFATLVGIYSIFEFWHIRRIGSLWFFAPKFLVGGSFLSKFSSQYSDVATSNSIISTLKSKELMFILFQKARDAIFMLMKIIHIPMLLFAFLIATVLYTKRYKADKLIKIIIAIILVLLVYAWFVILFVYPNIRFLSHGQINTASMYILITMFVVYLLCLRSKSLVPLFIILFYLLLLIWGFRSTFTERHFNQVLLVFFVGLGLFIDAVFKEANTKGKVIGSRSLFAIFFAGSLLYISISLFQSAVTIIQGVYYRLDDARYLKYADEIIPDNGIIVTGLQNDDFALIYSKVNNPIAYVRYTPYLIPQPDNISLELLNEVVELDDKIIYGKQLRDSGIGEDVVGFDFPKIINDPERFKKYEFYVLDYNVFDIQESLDIYNRNNSSHGTPPVKLKEIERYQNKRKIYKLEYKE